jgi:hypothetical protein
MYFAFTFKLIKLLIFIYFLYIKDKHTPDSDKTPNNNN